MDHAQRMLSIWKISLTDRTSKVKEQIKGGMSECVSSVLWVLSMLFGWSWRGHLGVVAVVEAGASFSFSR